MREYLKKAVPRPPESDAAVRAVVSEILVAVRSEGDAAVRRYSEKLDRWSPKSFKLTHAEIDAAVALLSADDRAKIDYCRDQIAAFARRQRESIAEFEVELQDGVRLGQRLIPVASVGAYVPGGPLSAGGLRAHEHHHRQGRGGRPRDRLLAAEPGERGEPQRRNLPRHALRHGRGRRR